MTTILFHHQHSGGLGSQVRVLSIARALKRIRPDLDIVVTAGNDYAAFDRSSIHGLRILSLPAMWLAPDRTRLFVRRASRYIHTSESDTRELRRRIIAEILNTLRPKVVVLDQFPLGRWAFRDEFRFLIQHSRRCNKAVKIVSSVKDIFGHIQAMRDSDQEFTNKISEEAIADLEGLVDVVAYHSDPALISWETMFKLASRPVPSTPHVATGFVSGGAQLAFGRVLDYSADIVLTAGSGLDGHHFLSEALAAADAIGVSPSRTLAVMGPLCPTLPYSLRQRLRGIRVLTQVSDLRQLFAQSRLAMTMGGSTLVAAAHARVPSLYFPRTDQETHAEQAYRANRFADAGFGHVWRRRDESCLQEAVQTLQSSNPHDNASRPRVDTAGATKAAKLLSTLLDGRSPPRSYVNLPYKAMVEVARPCNLKCPLCPVGNGQARSFPLMTRDNYLNIIQRIAPFISHLKLYNYGEPMLHPQISTFVRIAKDNGIERIEITTNGTLLGDDVAASLVQSGLTDYRVSIDGVEQHEYSQYRIGGSFQDVIENVKKLIDVRERLGSHTPRIELQFIVMRQNEGSIDAFESLASQLGVDSTRIKTVNVNMSGTEIGNELGTSYLPADDELSRYTWHGARAKVTIKPAYRTSFCRWPWDHIVILGDGTITPCCYDFNGVHPLGRVRGSEFATWWDTKARSAFQRAHMQRFAPYDMCRHCAYSTPDPRRSGEDASLRSQ